MTLLIRTWGTFLYVQPKVAYLRKVVYATIWMFGRTESAAPYKNIVAPLVIFVGAAGIEPATSRV